MNHSVLRCTNVYQSVLRCIKVYQSVLGFTKEYHSVLGCSKVYQSVLGFGETKKNKSAVDKFDDEGSCHVYYRRWEPLLN